MKMRRLLNRLREGGVIGEVDHHIIIIITYTSMREGRGVGGCGL